MDICIQIQYNEINKKVDIMNYSLDGNKRENSNKESTAIDLFLVTP